MEENTPETESAKPRAKGNVPVADVNFGNVITDVGTKWKATPAITLIWTDAATFDDKAGDFNEELNQRYVVGNKRPQISKRLQKLDADINGALPYVKSYLLEKYKEAATSYYPSFGIEHKDKKYSLPRDRNKRVLALGLMITAIAANGFGSKEFGTAFWTALEAEYQTLIGNATSTDGTVSTKVGTKNVLKKELKKILNSLILVIKGNYPDTYKTELRAWGFQKEKY